MAVTASTMLTLGTSAPDFIPASAGMTSPPRKRGLSDTKGNVVCLEDFKDAPALLVIFLCNHCPFVKHILDGLVGLVKVYQAKGVAVVGINSNDAANYPEDRPEMMDKVARQKGFTFPYLYDETQDVAKAYHAACTPDFFLFDKQGKLVYRGQMDDSRPGNGIPVTGADLRAALDAILEAKPAPAKQKPSMGCNIKWKPGAEPDYAR